METDRRARGRTDGRTFRPTDMWTGAPRVCADETLAKPRRALMAALDAGRPGGRLRLGQEENDALGGILLGLITAEAMIMAQHGVLPPFSRTPRSTDDSRKWLCNSL